MDVEKLGVLFQEVYKRENAGLHFAIDLERAEIIFMHMDTWKVDEWIATGGYDERYDKVLIGRVPYPD